MQKIIEKEKPFTEAAVSAYYGSNKKFVVDLLFVECAYFISRHRLTILLKLKNGTTVVNQNFSQNNLRNVRSRQGKKKVFALGIHKILRIWSVRRFNTFRQSSYVGHKGYLAEHIRKIRDCPAQNGTYVKPK